MQTFNKKEIPKNKKKKRNLLQQKLITIIEVMAKS